MMSMVEVIKTSTLIISKPFLGRAENPISFDHPSFESAKPREPAPCTISSTLSEPRSEIAPRENDAGKEGGLQGWAKALKIGDLCSFGRFLRSHFAAHVVSLFSKSAKTFPGRLSWGIASKVIVGLGLKLPT